MAEHPASAPHAPQLRAVPDAVAVGLQDVVVQRGGARPLDGLSAQLPARGITALMGPNGAGKSVALRVMAGLIPPDRGILRYGPGVAGRVATVFQRPVLLRRSVRANLVHALRLYRVPRAERRDRAEALLATAGLAHLADAPARSLSGGEAQRLCLVRALAASPRLLLLDEPTASTDPQSTLAIEALVREAAADGAKVVLITHDAGQARRLAGDVLFLHKGRACEHTPADRFFANPQSDPAADFLAGRIVL